LVDGKCLANLGDGGVEVGPVVGDHRGRDENAAVEVGEEELGAGLGAVEADDAEVFGTDLLDARMKDAAGLADGVDGSAPRRAPAGTGSGHETYLR
jgi:hypothetical protein